MTPAQVAVALHDVEPRTFERCALIRDWLDDLGVDKVTLLVIPASGIQSFGHRRPALVSWLHERAGAGDSVAQHGFRHRRLRRAKSPARALVADWQGGSAAEFPGLDADETRRAVEAGREVLEDAGLDVRGFVAPAYAYTRALRDALDAGYDWWASLIRVHTPGRAHTAPALCLGTSDPVKRVLSPAMTRIGGALLSHGRLLRVDLHPADFDHPGHVLALESVIAAAGRRRTAVTYDELVPAMAHA